MEDEEKEKIKRVKEYEQEWAVSYNTPITHTILISILKMGLPVTIIITVGRPPELKNKNPYHP